MSHLERILADGTDRDQWKRARYPVIGASDAKGLSKWESIPLYLRSKLSREIWTGNVFTDDGYRWEPMFCGWAGFEHNQALFHSPDEPGFAATPDGIKQVPGGIALAQCKVRHVEPGQVGKGPSLAEKRQMAWDFVVFPEAIWEEFIWGDVRKDNPSGDLVGDEPRSLIFHRNDEEMVALRAHVVPIATELLSRLRAALEAEKELNLA